MFKAIVAASVISLGAAASAQAASPMSPATAAGVLGADRAQSVIVDAQYVYRHGNRDSRRHERRQHSQRYVPGRHYGSAPRGWNRYAARPGDWDRRGCIVVGAVWFCP